jgi:hemerythrin-like domain-containing protein
MAKKDKDPTAIELLTEQHREVEELFEQYEAAATAKEKSELFEEIADQLAIHAKIEEQFFYPAVRAKKTEDMVLEAFVEHISVKRLLADLLDNEPEDPTFDAQMKVLKEQVEHHVEEEENQLFPAAKKVLNREELVVLAQEMLALQTELQSTDPRNSIPVELATSQPVAP